MLESIKQLHEEIHILKEYNNIDTDELEKIADTIEHEVEERYVEGPTDKNGDLITYDTMIEQWGALEYIACEMHSDGTYEWFVRGHDTSAPLEKAKHVTVMKPPTIEDVLREFAEKWSNTSYGSDEERELFTKYADRLQLKEE